jgi:hypothetical protein
MPKISQSAVDEYIKHNGIRCPWCKIGTVHSMGKPEVFDYAIEQPVCCDNPACTKEWNDVYILHDINEDAKQ